ncbi:MAG: GlxA family transcriptional regulator [Roseovarius sp.]
MTTRESDRPIRFVFLLIPGFSMLGFTCALEALSLANRHSGGRTYYDWLLLSADGRPAAAWNGVTVEVSGGLVELGRDDRLVVCAGEDVTAGSTREVLGWLRRQTRKGLTFGALSSGAYTLALAGLIAGKRVTTHWEYAPALLEALPQVTLEETIYTVDGRVFTCAGGASSMDLMLYLIREDYGQAIADWVAEQMVYPAPRDAAQTQRTVLQGRLALRDRTLIRAIELMRAHTEEPMSAEALAERLGVSTRRLERLFAKHLGTSPGRYYLALRLEKARYLLRQTERGIQEIGLLCGFTSAAHFSRRYKEAYGVAPSKESAGRKLLWTPEPRG